VAQPSIVSHDLLEKWRTAQSAVLFWNNVKDVWCIEEEGKGWRRGLYTSPARVSRLLKERKEQEQRRNKGIPNSAFEHMHLASYLFCASGEKRSKRRKRSTCNSFFWKGEGDLRICVVLFCVLESCKRGCVIEKNSRSREKERFIYALCSQSTEEVQGGAATC
jgi:hypothetical protein